MQSSPEDGASESKHYGSSSSESKPRHSKQQPRVIVVDDGESTHSDSKMGQVIHRRNDTDVIVYPPQAIRPSRERETRQNLPSEDRMRVDGDSNRSRAEGPKRQRARSLSSGYNRSYEATNSPAGMHASNNSTTGPTPNNRPPPDGQTRPIDSSTSNHYHHHESSQAPASRHRPGSTPTGTFELLDQNLSSDLHITPSTGVPVHQSHGALAPQSYSDDKTRKSSNQQDGSATKLQSDAGAVVASSRPPRKRSMDDHYLSSLKHDPSYRLPGTSLRDISNPPTETPGIDGTQPFVKPELSTRTSRDASSIGFGGVFVHAARSVFSSKVTEADEKIKRLKAEIDDLKKNNSELEANFNRNRRARKELQKDNQQLQEDLQITQYRLRQIEQELAESKNLAETRGKELMGAQVFLTKADSLSQEEIAGMVETLNQEIFQVAASFGEFLVFQKHDFTRDHTQYDRSLQTATQILGEGLVQTLINLADSLELSLNQLVIQSVISICLVNFCMKILRAWYAPDEDISIFIRKTYAKIMSKEEQAVSGRWRAITRAHTRVSSETYKQDLINSLQAIFNISFWSLKPEGQTAFEHQMSPFFKIIDDLNVALGEKFTSADLEVYDIRAGDKFNHRYMEDVFEDSRRCGADHDRSNIVVGTAGLGLRKTVSVRSASSGLLQASMELLLPAKVVLDSTLQEALEPPPPRKARQRRD